MVEIRIVSGAYAAHPNGQHKVVTKGQTVCVSEEEAAEVVALGVAVYEKETVLMAESPAEGVAEEDTGVTPEEEQNPEETAPEGLETPDGIETHLDAEDLQKMTFANLKKLASDMGLQPGKLRSRQAIIDALIQEPVYVNPDEEDPPVMEAEDPV